MSKEKLYTPEQRARANSYVQQIKKTGKVTQEMKDFIKPFLTEQIKGNNVSFIEKVNYCSLGLLDFEEVMKEEE